MTRKECTLTRFRVWKWCPYNIMMCFSKTCPNGSWVMLSIFNQTSCSSHVLFASLPAKLLRTVNSGSFFFFLLQSLFTSFRMKEPKSTFEASWEENLRNKESLLCFGSKMIFSTSDVPLSLLPSYLSSHFLSWVRDSLSFCSMCFGEMRTFHFSFFSVKREDHHDVHSSSLFPSSIHLLNNKERLRGKNFKD